MGLIVSLIISFVVPDIDNTVCDAILGQLPPELLNGGDCGCDLTIGGLISVEIAAEAVCTIEFGEGRKCELEISGGGDAFGVAFGGTGPLSFSSDCDVDEGVNVDLDVSGVFSTSSIALNSCSVELTYGEPEETLQCNCDSIGCEGDFFAASVVCMNGNETLLDEDCINFSDLAGEFFTADIPAE